MLPRTREKVVRELLVWLQYFVISSLAAVWAYDSYITKRYGPPTEGVDVNLMGLLRVMWSMYLVPWLGAFFSLCAVRFLLLFLSSRIRRKSDEAPGEVVGRSQAQ
jgi:hypothetical protein